MQDVRFIDTGGTPYPAFYFELRIGGRSPTQIQRVVGQAADALERWGGKACSPLVINTFQAIGELARNQLRDSSDSRPIVVRVSADRDASVAQLREDRSRAVAYAMLFNDDPDPMVAEIWQVVMDSFNAMYFRDLKPGSVDDDVGRAACSMRGAEVEVDRRLKWDRWRWRPSQCYKLAYLYALNRVDEVRAVLGVDLRIVHGRYLTDLPHAWVEFGDLVYDGTCATFYDRNSFHLAVEARPQATYSLPEAIAHLQRTGNFGSWHRPPVEPAS